MQPMCTTRGNRCPCPRFPYSITAQRRQRVFRVFSVVPFIRLLVHSVIFDDDADAADVVVVGLVVFPYSRAFFSLSLSLSLFLFLLQFCWRDNSWTRTSFCVCIVSSRVSSNNNSKPKMKQTKKLHNNFGHIFMRIALFATQHTEVAHIHSIQRHRQIHRLRLFYAEFSFLMSKRRRYNESRRTNLSWFLPFHFYYYVLQLYFRHLRSFFFPFVLRAFSLVFLLYDTRRKDSEWMRTDWVGEMLLVRCLQFLNSVNVTWQRRHSDMALAHQQTLQNCYPIGIW